MPRARNRDRHPEPVIARRAQVATGETGRVRHPRTRQPQREVPHRQLRIDPVAAPVGSMPASLIASNRLQAGWCMICVSYAVEKPIPQRVGIGFE